MADDHLDRAVELAARAYDGRTDRQGDPYIAHAIRVMLAMRTDDERAVAILHDVFEWGRISLREFVAAKLPKRIVDAVDAMTKREGETLEEHVERILASELAVAVKRADLVDNALEHRLERLPTQQRERLVAMYRETARLLGDDLDALCGRPVA